MVRFGKKAAILAMAGVLTAASVTGCSGAIDAEATVVTVGKEKVPLGVVNFYARMMQGQYETYYAGMMGTTAEELWTQDAGDDKTYEESVKDSVMEAVENMYLISQHSGEYEVVLTEDEKEAIQKAAEQKVVRPADANFCCGEGTCGACTCTDENGKTIHRCKMRD